MDRINWAFITRVGACVLSAGIGAAASAHDLFVEEFTGGSNVGGWTYFAPDEFIAPTGGNPGAYLRANDLDTFAPMPQTAPGVDSPFVGDYRARNVVNVGVDLALFHVDFSAEERPLTLMLVNDNGTPFDFNDDTAAYVLGEQIPLVGEGWKTYGFDVPSQEASLPSNWRLVALGSESPAPDWSTIIQNVDMVRFFYGDPEFFFIFQMWDLGLDNPTIVWEGDDHGTPATITHFTVVRGTLLGGGVGDMIESDDARLRVRSGFGDTFADLHSMILTVSAQTDVEAPLALDVTIESRISHASGTARIALRDFGSGNFVPVGSYAINQTEAAVTIADLDGARFVSDAGDIEVQIRHVVFVPFFAFTFESGIDQVLIEVRPER